MLGLCKINKFECAVMEINPLVTRIKDYADRTAVIRGYL